MGLCADSLQAEAGGFGRSNEAFVTQLVQLARAEGLLEGRASPPFSR